MESSPGNSRDILQSIRRNAFAWAAFSIALLTPIAGRASNFHEHLTITPSYEDLETASRSVTGKSLDQFPDATSVVKPTEVYTLFGSDVLRNLVGPSFYDHLTGGKGNFASILQFQKTHTDPWPTSFSRLTLGELSARIARATNEINITEVTSRELVLRSLFTAPVAPATRGADEYVSRMILRSNVFDSFGPKGIYRNFLLAVFSAYLDRVPVQDRKVVSITTNNLDRFTRGHGTELLNELRELFRKKGSKLEVLLGVTRKRLASSKVNEIENLDKLVGPKGYDGVDFTGGMHETDRFNSATERANYAENIRKAFQKLGQVNASTESRSTGFVAKIQGHYYEASRDHPDDFFAYEALWKGVEAPNAAPPERPVEFRLAHINEFGENDVAIAQRARGKTSNVRFLMIGNVKSNEVVQSAEVVKLAKNINQLVDAGFTVVLGEDGGGILPGDSSMTATLKRLRAGGLSDAAYRSILEASEKASHVQTAVRSDDVGVEIRKPSMPDQIQSLVTCFEKKFRVSTLKSVPAAPSR